MKKKIAIINSVCGTGSTGRICADLSEFLNLNGFETKIFFGRNKNNFGRDDAYCFGNRFSLLCHALKARIFDSSGIGSYFATKKLIKMLEIFNPDLIICNNLHGYYLNIKEFLEWVVKRNKKVISVFHDCWNFTGHCAHFDIAGCEKWKNGCEKCIEKHSYPKSLLLDASRRNYALKKQLFTNIENLSIICPSKWLAYLTSQSFFKNRKIYTINNGIDLSKFKNTHHNKDERFVGKKIILCVANVFDKKKGIFDINELAKMLIESELIILIGHIKEKVSLHDKIIHIDHIENINELAHFYSMADVMFNPTYEDTFSNTNMESLSCGTPVICYKTGGAFEMLDDSYVVEKGDLKSAYALMQNIFKQNIRNLQHGDFSREKMHKEYLKAIREIVE